MRYIVQGNYRKFNVVLTQKSGELITPYVPAASDVVSIMLLGAKNYEFPDYEQSGNVLSFTDNGNIKVGLYALEVKVVESTSHRLRCMYREQVRVVLSNDDIPTTADFENDDVVINAELDMGVVVDDALSTTSKNPVQNKVVTEALNNKAENLAITRSLLGVQFNLKRGDAILSHASLLYAGYSQGQGGLMSGYDYTKLSELPTSSELQNELNKKGDKAALPNDISRSQVDATFVHVEDGVITPLFYLRQATQQMAGLLTKNDKVKLDGLPTATELTAALGQKQNTLTWDAQPTQGSDNAISSGAVYNVLGNIESILDVINGD